MTKSKWIFIILFFSLSMLSFDRLIDITDASKNSHFSEKVNLALRRTAHHLLKASGDSTSQIEPVKMLDERSFKIRLERNFTYDLLPKLLEESFKIHQIDNVYDVSVLDCNDGELTLGYNSFDFKKDKNVPCIGRQQDKTCYDLQITFAKKPIQNSPKPMWLIPLWGLFITGFIFWNRKATQVKTESEIINQKEVSESISFGNSNFDFTNQTLFSGNVQHNLTYREAKLLRLFVNNQNQLLERDFILKSVWEDEGITVGRSLDVFVSRLRKMLSSDSTVQIVTLHGVGYKLVSL
ncbi:transcriptional regulator [Arcicella aurantiaca]|uniref:Transcriptional regulator n=1 Tax=Arcicella aurantiaca TaxID=591202 RepID=A0A316EA55_9BACT|nr:winged helix-turn-helix domain-containing protein [Arcicella aurantiaca]PWK27282.1 transcriptional regulator [Arcicella aurantiaca]